MKYLLTACAVSLALVSPAAFAQTQPPPAAPTQTQPAPRPKPQTPPVPRSTPQTMTIEVTDKTGAPVADVHVALAGSVDRSGATGEDGTMVFRSLRPGTYRLRFEREGFTTLEREVLVRAGQPPNVSVVLTPAPVEKKTTPTPTPAAPVPPARPARPVDALALSLTDFLEKNFVGSAPLKTSMLVCSDGGTAQLLQLRDPLENQQHGDADEYLYVVAGEGTVRVRDQETKVRSGFFAFVPRGFPHSLRRQGRNPLIVLSVLGGAPCMESGAAAR